MKLRGLFPALWMFSLAALPAAAAMPKSVDVGGGQLVWFAEDHTVAMVAVSVSLPAGSVYDPAGKPGLAALAAYLFNEGAGSLNAAAYQGELAQRAIQISMSPDRDYFTVTVATLSSNVKDAFRLLGLALVKPRFDSDAIVRVRDQMLQSLEQEGEDPASVATRRFNQTFFAGYPYAHDINGTAAGLHAISVADLRTFAHAHWVRGGVKIAVAGDIDTATLTALLKATFGPLPAAAPPAPARDTHVGAPGTTMMPMSVPQPTALFGLPGMMRSDPDYLAGYVANYIVGGGNAASRLTSEVREKRGLTYAISTSFGDYRAAGYVIGQVATRRENMDQSLAVIRDVLRKFATEGPTARELADAKTYLTGSFPLAFASNAGIAAQLNAFQRAGLPIEYIARRNSLIDALTLDDVRRASRRLFDPARMTVVVAGTVGAEPAARIAAKPTNPAAHR